MQLKTDHIKNQRNIGNRSQISRLKEIELINKSKEDISHFEPLYSYHYSSILNYIYQKIGEKELSEDITSQVFLKAMVNIKRYQVTEHPFSAWLYKIAFNETMLFFRKSKKLQLVTIDDFLVQKLHEKLEISVSMDIYPYVVEQFHHLKRVDMELIELRFFEMKSFKDISYILGISENNAKVKLHRVLKQLKNKLIKETKNA